MRAAFDAVCLRYRHSWMACLTRGYESLDCAAVLYDSSHSQIALLFNSSDLLILETFKSRPHQTRSTERARGCESAVWKVVFLTSNEPYTDSVSPCKILFKGRSKTDWEEVLLLPRNACKTFVSSLLLYLYFHRHTLQVSLLTTGM